MKDLSLAKQVTALSKALSRIQLYQFWGGFQLLDYKSVYEVEANLIYSSIHILMNV